MVSQNFTRSEYDHLENGMFIILVLYVVGMLIASKSMVDIKMLKAQLARTFYMEDLGATKLILGREIHRDRKNGKLRFSQESMLKKYL